MPTITFTVDENGGTSLELKGPKSIHKLKGDFDRDLAEVLGGDTKTVEKAELTERETPLTNTPQKQSHRR